MWNKILNPKTGKKVNINSKIGKSILRNYIKQIGGAEAEEVIKCFNTILIEDENLEDYLLKNPNNFVIENNGRYSCQNIDDIFISGHRGEPIYKEHQVEFFRCYDKDIYGFREDMEEQGNIFKMMYL